VSGLLVAAVANYRNGEQASAPEVAFDTPAPDDPR
jgi:hypothetical protein